jgi:hypothetical protein
VHARWRVNATPVSGLEIGLLLAQLMSEGVIAATLRICDCLVVRRIRKFEIIVESLQLGSDFFLKVHRIALFTLVVEATAGLDLVVACLVHINAASHVIGLRSLDVVHVSHVALRWSVGVAFVAVIRGFRPDPGIVAKKIEKEFATAVIANL